MALGWLTRHTTFEVNHETRFLDLAESVLRSVTDFPLNGCRQLTFADSQHAWGVGEWGRLFVTTNGGTDWTSLTGYYPGGDFGAVSFADLHAGWAVGLHGVIQHATNDSMNRQQMSADTTVNFRSLAGETWIGWDSGLDRDLAAVTTVEGGNWSVGADGVILHYSGATPVTPRSSVAEASRCSISAFPNPFNSDAMLSISLPASGRISLSVYDVTGRCVQTLTDGFLSAGTRRIRFDGSRCAGGVYFARLTTPGEQVTQKLILLK